MDPILERLHPLCRITQLDQTATFFKTIIIVHNWPACCTVPLPEPTSPSFQTPLNVTFHSVSELLSVGLAACSCDHREVTDRSSAAPSAALQRSIRLDPENFPMSFDSDPLSALRHC